MAKLVVRRWFGEVHEEYEFSGKATDVATLWKFWQEHYGEDAQGFSKPESETAH